MTTMLFAYVGFTVALLVMLALAVVLLASGLLRKPRKAGRAAAGGALLVGVVTCAAALWWEEQIDFNPLVRSPSQLTGTWQDGASRLDLHADGRYTCGGETCAQIGAEGRWLREGDFYIVFRPLRGHEVSWRMVVREQHLWLAAGELDERLELGFRQVGEWVER